MNQMMRYYFERGVLMAVVVFLGSGAAFGAEHIESREVDRGLRGGLYNDNLYLLDGTLSLSNGNGDLEYQWSQLSGPPIKPATDFLSPRFFFRAESPGRYEFSLVVSADGRKSDPCVVTVLIKGDEQPVPRIEMPPPIKFNPVYGNDPTRTKRSTKHAKNYFGRKM